MKSMSGHAALFFHLFYTQRKKPYKQRRTKRGRNMTNGEKILEMLEWHSELLEQQGKVLAQHSEILADLQKTVTKVAITQEAVVLPQLDLLAEGYTHLVDTLASKERVEALENDINTVKSSIKFLSQETNKLKKAQ